MTDGLLLAVIGRPSSAWLTAATVFVLGGWLLHLWLEYATRPPLPVPVPADERRPDPLPGTDTLETPAIIGLLTNGYQVPPSAVPATVMDLSARGWLSMGAQGGRLILHTGRRPPAHEGMEPYEQYVSGYLRSLATNESVTGPVLARNQRKLDRRWWSNFRRQVANSAQDLGLTVNRYPLSSIASVGAVTLLAAFSLLRAIVDSSDVSFLDSWRSRGWWLLMIAGVVALGLATVRRNQNRHQFPTELGQARADAWVGYRARLDARIPEGASVLGTPQQQRALAEGLVTGLAASAYQQLPIVRRNPRWGWSTAGGTAHTVRIHYPARPGYGAHPYVAVGVGLGGLIATWLLRGLLISIADGDRWADATDWFGQGDSIIRPLIGTLGVLMIVPLLVSLWLVIAGVADSLVTREHFGMVVRTAAPKEVLPGRAVRLVQPFGRRSGFRSYLAVDTAARPSVYAWLAPASRLAPQRSDVRVRVTPLLGHVRSCEPVAHADVESAFDHKTGSVR